MTTFFIDTHCHLDLFENIQTNKHFEDYAPIKTITVTNAPRFYKPNNTLFQQAKNIRVALGLHPELVENFGSEISEFIALIGEAKYIGEIGLDGSARFRKSFSEQVGSFDQILSSIASHSGKIVTAHSRNAAGKVIEMLSTRKVMATNKVILHWYTGNIDNLMRAVEEGVYISFNHKMLQTEKGLEILKVVPMRRILTETDAPFTFDARIRNRMQSLNMCVELMSKALKISKDGMKESIYENFRDLLSF